MPYSEQQLRELFNPHIEVLQEAVREFDLDDREGLVNYIITRVTAGSLKPLTGWRYKSASRAWKEMLHAAHEFARRILDKLEDDAIERNGDIPEYAEFDKERKT